MVAATAIQIEYISIESQHVLITFVLANKMMFLIAWDVVPLRTKFQTLLLYAILVSIKVIGLVSIPVEKSHRFFTAHPIKMLGAKVCAGYPPVLMNMTC